jgi:RNA polymerase primary sigma factor
VNDYFYSYKKPMENYFREIGKDQLLSPEEEIELAKRIKMNDQKALNRLVQANLRFVVSIAKLYQNKGLSLDDLINEGNLGLIKAAYRFDESRGFKFISYAVWWVRQSILQAIAEKTRMIRIPLNRVATLTKASKVYNKLEQEYKREPTHEEIAVALDLNSKEITDTLRTSSHHVSIDSSLKNNGGSRLLDIIRNPQKGVEPEDKVMEESLREEINYILNTLTYRESKILKLYFGLDGEKPHTLEEVGAIFKVTRERIRQIKEKALKKLRRCSRSSALRSYL